MERDYSEFVKPQYRHQYICDICTVNKHLCSMYMDKNEHPPNCPKDAKNTEDKFVGEFLEDGKWSIEF